jgi:hypothetical protein
VREARVGCQDHTHDHHRLVWMRPVDRDDQPGVDMLLSIWLCPVFHQIGAWAGFPLAGETAVDDAESDEPDEPERRRPRLFHRD